MCDIPWDENHPLFGLDEHDFYGEDPRADFGHWSKAAYWTVEEGIALSYGRNPRIVNWAFLSANSEHPFAQNYADRLDLGLRAKAVGQLRDVNDPAAFISWTKRVAFEFPPELANAVQLRGNAVRDWQSEYESLAEERNSLAAKVKKFEQQSADSQLFNKPLLESERTAMLTMIAGMAARGYRYVPTGNSRVPQEIADDIVASGLSLDVKTVRKYLDTAAKLLPPD
jgi:hypothetical protein